MRYVPAGVGQNRHPRQADHVVLSSRTKMWRYGAIGQPGSKRRRIDLLM
jgi:hypothetical protein